jgi:hypothetical protein
VRIRVFTSAVCSSVGCTRAVGGFNGSLVASVGAASSVGISSAPAEMFPSGVVSFVRESETRPESSMATALAVSGG